MPAATLVFSHVTKPQSNPLLLRFMDVTGADLETAKEFMLRARNDVNAAVSSYNFDPAVQLKKQELARCSTALTTIFQKYAALGDDPNAIFEDGLFRFFEDVGVPSSTKMSIMPLAVAWELNCASPGEISKTEFTKGFAAASCDSIPRIRTHLALLRQRVESRHGNSIRDLYQWLFGFAKENKERKVLYLSEAVAFWTDVLPLLPTSWVGSSRWLAFLEEHKDQFASISADLWMNVFDFSKIVGDDLSKHNDGDAWHTGIDSFVEWMRASAPTPAASGASTAAATATGTVDTDREAPYEGCKAQQQPSMTDADTDPTGSSSASAPTTVSGAVGIQVRRPVATFPASAAVWARVPVIVIPPKKTTEGEFDT